MKKYIYTCITLFFHTTIQAVAGLLADARQLLSVARDEAKQYKHDYGVPIPVKVCIQ
jgi:20S proteasome alpha/beta subunit